MKKFFKNSGFTLFELLAVLAILAIVAGIAVPRVMQTIRNARVTALEAEMQLVASTIQRMFMEEEINAPGNSPGMDVQFYIEGVDVSDTAGEIDEDTLVSTYTEYAAATDFLPYVDDGTDGFTPATATQYSTELSLEDYLEGGVPEYFTVLVVDENAVTGVDSTTQSNIGAIVVIYDELYATYSSVEKADLTLTNDSKYTSLGTSNNVVIKTFEYSGKIGE